MSDPLVAVRNPHAAAVLALVNTRWHALSASRTAYEMDDKAKATLPNYGQITLSRRFGGQARVGGPLSPSLWRLTLRAVGDSVANVRVMLDAGTEALEDHTITVGDEISTPIAFELEDEIRQDDTDKNLWSGLTSWTYAF